MSSTEFVVVTRSSCEKYFVFVVQVPKNTNFTTYQLDSVSMITNQSFEQSSDDTFSIIFLLLTDNVTVITVTLTDVQGVNLVFEYTICKLYSIWS